MTVSHDTVAATEGSETLRDFWSQNQPGFKFSSAEVGSPAFFAEVEAHRYALEPGIKELVRFERWRDRDVLEVGCGIGTDALQFARAGSRYTGLDLSPPALALAERRFESEGLAGEFLEGSASALPFADGSFDLLYSHGVIHHIPSMEAAVAEFRRVLRPGGTAIVMVYHRNSLNYFLNIMILRRALIGLLLLPQGIDLVARLTGEEPTVLRGQRELLTEHGPRYLTDTGLFLSNNTDGPGNPLSRALSRDQARRLFAGFGAVSTSTRFLNLRLYPGGERLATTRLGSRLERRVGWHLWIEARVTA